MSLRAYFPPHVIFPSFCQPRKPLIKPMKGCVCVCQGVSLCVCVCVCVSGCIFMCVCSLLSQVERTLSTLQDSRGGGEGRAWEPCSICSEQMSVFGDASAIS